MTQHTDPDAAYNAELNRFYAAKSEKRDMMTADAMTAADIVAVLYAAGAPGATAADVPVWTGVLTQDDMAMAAIAVEQGMGDTSLARLRELLETDQKWAGLAHAWCIQNLG